MKLKPLGLAVITALLSSYAWGVEDFVVQDIRIEGLERTEPSTIFSYLPIKIGDTFTDIRGEEIIKSLYSTGFFEDIQVETQNNQVLLTVTERPIINSLNVSGAKMIPNDNIKKTLESMGLVQARVFDPVILARAVEGLRSEYMNLGKNQVNIEPQITKLDRNRVAIDLKITEGDTTVLRDIRFSGNEHFSERTLRDEMDLTENGLFTWFTKSNRFSGEKLSTDLQKIIQFYRNHGYFNAQIINTEVLPDQKHPEDLNLHITLNEGQRYRWGLVQLAGDSKEIPMQDLEKLIKVKTGKWFEQNKLEDILSSLQRRLGDNGYANAEINVQPRPDNEHLNFVLTLIPREKIYVNNIHISGNNKTRDEVIRREMRQMESAPYDYGKIERSKERIQQLGYFGDVNITSVPVENALDQVDLNVSVQEQPTGSIEVAAGYAQDEGVVLSAGVSQDNIFGSGKSASARIVNSSSNKRASLSFTDPYFTPDGVSLGYDLFARSYDARKSSVSSYKTTTMGGGVRMGVPITEYDRLNFGLGAQHQKLNIYEDSPYRYKKFVEDYGNKNWTITGNIGWGRNTTDSAFWPTRGYMMNVDLEAGLPGGDIQYYKLTHEQKWFFPLTKNLTWMISGAVGYGDGYGKMKTLPFYNHFYAGGLGSVRGFEGSSLGPKVREYNNSIDYLGGTRQALLNTELLMPFPGMSKSRTVRFSLFADAGSVWDGKKYTSADYDYYGDAGHKSTFKNELRYSAGAALTWISPLGPLKFSYAHPLNKKKGDEVQRFQFQLGTVF